MKFSLIAALALFGSALALPAGATGTVTKLASGAACSKDGSMGICESGFCLQDSHDSQGTCK